MAKLVPFSGTMAQLYQSYCRRAFIGMLISGYGDSLNGVGVAGYVDTIAGSTDYVFYFGRRTIIGNFPLNGFVIA